MPIDWNIIVILASVAFVASFVDAIAGGGGLITIPALLLVGLEPLSAIATNKFQGSFSSISATIALARRNMIDWREGRFLIPLSMFGGVLGALFVSLINKRWLEASVPVLLILVAAYFAFTPIMDIEEKHKKKLSIGVLSFLIAPLFGFYDGMFGPGVGSFFMMAFIFLGGLNTLRAISFTKLANASCNVGALAIFITKGTIMWPFALAMALASFLGAQLGICCAIHVGGRLIRPMIVIVCCVMAIKLVSAQDNPLRVALFSFLKM